jgi:fatty acid desaturase
MPSTFSQDSGPATPQLRGQELAAIVRDLQVQRFLPGAVKILGFTLATLTLLLLAFAQSNPLLFGLCGIVLGVVYASFMILTHDAIHHTLTGFDFIDEVFAHLLSWPMLWPHSTYGVLHKLHHNMNGRDEADPERCHLTTEEYAKAGPLRRLLARHQLLYRVLIAGGLGMIFNTLRQARRYAHRSKAIQRALIFDTLGIIVTTIILFGSAAYFDVALEAVVIWIIIERTVGAVQQFRSHLEHYGLWEHYPSFLESQIYNTRNFRTNRFASFFFNGLNYHSVHHAFPSIPFYHLKEAHIRIGKYCDDKGAPLHEEVGYARAALAIIIKPRFVKPFVRCPMEQEA